MGQRMKTKAVSKTYVTNIEHVSASESGDTLINILYNLPWITCTSSSCLMFPVTRSSGTYRLKHKDSVPCTIHRNLKGIVKAVPLQAWSGPEGSRKLRSSNFMTTAQDCGKVVSLKYRPSLPHEIHLVLIYVRD
jgi:hypothetical protein